MKLLAHENYRNAYWANTRHNYDLIDWDSLFNDGDTTNIWLTICNVLKWSAATALKPRTNVDSPLVIQDRNGLKQALFQNILQPTIGNCALVQIARQELQRRLKEDELENYKRMISELSELPEQERMRFDFKYFKRKKRACQSVLYANIPISQWEQELTRSEGPPDVNILGKNLAHVFLRSKSRPIFFLWSSAPLEPPVESLKAPAWPADFELLRRVSEL